MVSDAVLNPTGRRARAAWAALEAHGWGAVALPPPALPGDEAEAWVDATVDQVAELRRHGAQAVAVVDDADARRWAPRLATLGTELLPVERLAPEELRRRLERAAAGTPAPAPGG